MISKDIDKIEYEKRLDYLESKIRSLELQINNRYNMLPPEIMCEGVSTEEYKKQNPGWIDPYDL
jgi:hypothetical protein